MNPELLIIDDDPFALALSHKTARLVIATHKVRIFSSAKDALEYLVNVNSPSDQRYYRCGLICSDLHMPEMDGFEFLDEFAQLPDTIQDRYKVFILSSVKEESEIRRLYEKRCFEGFCPKPLTVEKLKFLLQQTAA